MFISKALTGVGLKVALKGPWWLLPLRFGSGLLQMTGWWEISLVHLSPFNRHLHPPLQGGFHSMVSALLARVALVCFLVMVVSCCYRMGLELNIIISLVSLTNFFSCLLHSPISVSFFELLGVVGSMKGMTTNSVASECVLKKLEEGEINMINGSEAQQFAAHFVVPDSDSDTDPPPPLQTCNFAKFAATGEDTPLQRAEWIKFLGAFTNLEYRANQVYKAVKDNYMCLTKAVEAKEKSFKPIVAWMEYYNGIWSFTKETYKLKFVEDAKGENVDGSINKITYNISNPDDIEDLHAILCTVDVVIDETFSWDPFGYNVSTFLLNINIEDHSCFGFLANQSLWRYDKRIHNLTTLDWFDGAVSQPQLVLADLIEILFPTGTYNTTFFRNIAKGEGVISIEANMCDRDSSTPMDPSVPSCS
ncbi:hypothetical protein PTKIN_Ptkin12aG0001600 [Pterospermum kingtungense]